MAYSTDRTWTTGEVVTEAMFNAHLRDNMKWCSTDHPMFRGYNSAGISTAGGSPADLTMDTERFDNASMHSTSSNTNRITAPTGMGGKYLAGGSISWSGSGAGANRDLIALVDGTEVARQSGPIVVTAGGITNLTTLYAVAAASYFHFQGHENAAGGLTVARTANWGLEFWCMWMGV